MKHLGWGFFLFVLLIGCSNSEFGSPSENANTNNNENLTEIKKEIERVKSENEFLKEKIANISVDIQSLDHKSRKIMNLIKDSKLEDLKSDFMVDFELSDDNVFIFEGHDDITSFSTDLAPLPMYFAYYNPQTDGMGIGYHVYGGAEGEEFKRTISFYYDVNYNLKYISAGE